MTDFQNKILRLVSRGYGLSASKRGYKAKEYREILELIERGLIRVSKPVPWNRAGAFVANPKTETKK